MLTILSYDLIDASTEAYTKIDAMLTEAGWEKLLSTVWSHPGTNIKPVNELYTAMMAYLRTLTPKGGRLMVSRGDQALYTRAN